MPKSDSNRVFSFDAPVSSSAHSMETRKGRETDPKLSLRATCNVIVLSLDFMQASLPPNAGRCVVSILQMRRLEPRGKMPVQRSLVIRGRAGITTKAHVPPKPILPPPQSPGSTKRSQACLLWSPALPPCLCPASFTPIRRVLPIPLSGFTIQLSVTEKDATSVVRLVRAGTPWLLECGVAAAIP